MADAPPQSKTNRRNLILGAAGGVAAIAVALGMAGLYPSGDDQPPSSGVSAVPTSSTTAATTSSLTPTTSFVPDMTSLSPFDREDLVSRTRSIPENPAVEAAATFYVDPSRGLDSATGAMDDPVATLEAARRLARNALREVTGDVVVYLRGGIHPRSDTFALGFQDSGRDGGNMVYRSYPGEQAILDGGVRVEGWVPAFGSVMKASVPDQVSDMRQFFAAGQRQPRARSATASGTAIEFLQGPLFNRQRNVAMAVETSLVEGFDQPTDLELVYVGVSIAGHGVTGNDGSEMLRPSWKAHRLPVSEVTDIGNGRTRLDIGNAALYHASERGYAPLELLPGDPFFLENALELLDEPGEWYFDSREREIYWWPPSAGATADAWVPVTEVLLNLDGTPRRPIRNVRIEGIAFRHAAYTAPNDEGYAVSQAANWFTAFTVADWMEVDGDRHPYLDGDRFPGLPGSAVGVDSARDIVFSGNVFSQLGAVGVMLHNDVRRATLDGNLFSDISAAALVAGHPVHDEIDEPMEGPIAELVLTNNVVDRAAAEFYASVGMQLTKVSGATVSNNLFHDLPYTALSLGWGWNNNPDSTVHRALLIENNYFENVMHTLYDGAPIYLLGPVAEPGAALRDYTRIRGNFANNATAGPQFKAPSEQVDPGFAKRPGVQLDEGFRNVQVKDNVFSGSTVWLQVTPWWARRNQPGWIEGLGLTGSGNWSDNPSSVPGDSTLVGVMPAQVFDFGELPEEVLQIIAGAGLQAGVEIPPLP